jgi:hypothetical protein
MALVDLNPVLAAGAQPPIEPRHRLILEQLPHRDFQLLTPAVPAVGPEVENLAAVAQPGFLREDGLPRAGYGKAVNQLNDSKGV